MKRCFSLVMLLAFVGWTRAEVAPLFYIASPPLGDDTHDGSAKEPFASLDRARLAVRAHLAARDIGDIVVEMAAGEYDLAAPVHFTAADSGRDNADVVYRAAPNAKVILSGGRRVTGWTRAADGVYRAEVGRGVDFRQLRINGVRATRARTPNAGKMFTMGFEKEADGFDLPREQLAGLALRPGEVEISVLIAWMHKRLRIADTKDTDRADTIRAVIESPEWDAITKQPQGDRVYLGRHYWLENAREFLDAPGEFFLDRGKGELSYLPRPGEDMERAIVIRPELDNLIVLDGRPDAPVDHLRFEGLTFAHSGWTRPDRYGFVDVQANSLVPAEPAKAIDPQYRHNQRKDRIPAAFQATTSDRIVVRGCHFTSLGGAGIVFTHGGNDNVIEGNSFVDLAAGGIEFGEDAARPSNPRLFPRRNRIANNFLAHIGQDYFGSVAILGYYTDASLITHNEITAVPYTGISQGWGWENPPGPDDARANRIIANRISNFMRRLDDGGGIYTTGRQPGSEISGNFITRMLTPDARTKAGGAIYPDQCTEGFDIYHNVVTESSRWLYLWNPNIRGNRVENNYADTAMMRNDGPDNFVEPVTVVSNVGWPEPAKAIAHSAGLEPAFNHVRETEAVSDVIVESHSVDFQPVAGAWTGVIRSGSYGGCCQESTDPKAAARWVPVLSKEGFYNVSVWRPTGSAAATYVVRHARGETRITLGADARGGHWTRLGEYRFRAGTEGELMVLSAAKQQPQPLIADAVRFACAVVESAGVNGATADPIPQKSP
jgi:hypothetical protein